MAGMILEGGTFRPIFSCGVMDCLLEHDVNFPYVIGVSAGITDGFSYVSKQPKRNLDILLNHRHDKKYVGMGNMLKEKSLFGLKYAFETIPNELHPVDYETFMSNPAKILVGVTNARTGQIEYLDGKELDRECTMIKATCAIPFVFPVIPLNGNEYYDGGICDPIPIRKSISDGNEKNLIILTREKGYKKSLSKANIIAAKALKKKYPALVEPLLNRHVAYNETIEFIEELEREGKAIVLRPDKHLQIDSFEKDLNKIKRIYDYGYELALNHLEEIKALL